MNLTKENIKRKAELAREYRSDLTTRPYAAILNLNAIGALELQDFSVAAKAMGALGHGKMTQLAYDLGLPVDYTEHDYGNEPSNV